MHFLASVIDLFVHLDVHLASVIARFGALTYGILFCIIFGETGLVIAPFLPGDSLLFAAGAFAAAGSLSIAPLFFLLWGAAVLGNIVNYAIGKFLGPDLFLKRWHLLKREHLEKTHAFFATYGAKTIILTRFLPIVRTVAPFVAGVGGMRYGTFLLYNLVGGFAWVALFLFGGYLFGNIPAVQHNFTLVILAIVAVSILPMVVSFIRHKRKSQRGG